MVTRLPPGPARTAVAYAVAALLWATLIFAFSAQPNLRFAPDAGWDFVIRKTGHMAVFGLLALFVWRAAAERAISRPALWALLITVAYAVTDEIHQGFTEGRHPALIDVGFDAAGAVIALLAAKLIVEWASRTTREAKH